MSYISAYKPYNSSEVVVWERTSHGREVRLVPAPYYFYVEDPEGKHKTIYNKNCTKLSFRSSSDLRKTKEECKSAGFEMYESDIPPELRVLSDLYYNQPPPTLHYTLLDIEVDYSPDIGFADVDNPYAPINAIALYHEWNKKAVCIAVPPDNSWTYESLMKDVGKEEPIPTNLDFEMILVKNEKELLLKFLEFIENSDVLSGWNSDAFDLPYITIRLEKIGKKYAKKLCFPEGADVVWKDIELNGMPQKRVELSGRNHVDYMELFKKYEVEERPSYKLEMIAEEVLPHLPKLNYEGSLAKLYKENFPYFVRYNIRDTEILAGFEQKLGYLDVANKMVHISTGLFKHVMGTLKLAELACINYCHHELNLVVTDMKHHGESSIKGAYVLYPQIGDAEWIANVDVTSLYPSAIRSINLSPETLIGQFVENVDACEEINKRSDVLLNLVMEHTDERISMTAKEFREYLIKNKFAISGYGTVCIQHKEGIIPSILSNWFRTRKEYQKKSKEAANEADALLKKYMTDEEWNIFKKK